MLRVLSLDVVSKILCISAFTRQNIFYSFKNQIFIEFVEFKACGFECGVQHRI